ncbi:drug/metabolite exporter YedA [Longimicrobium sp.]|uniref:drug/metabolite exporter YedA n=1 Tax=Longimicrobium sp. TaxID=2029185 RepID=UPI002BB29C0B|nr:drug/metabolite exporter YedA [Longimicrobium sp.]HSU17723.1 drug/metabolite exporter YedA [Longimicrobium sp.]
MVETTGPGRAKTIAAFAIVYVVWGSTYLAILYAIRAIPPLLMAGARFAAAGVILYTVLRLRGAERPTRRNWMAAAVAGTGMLVMGNGAVTWAEQRVPSGVAALVVASVPLWMVILEWARPRGRLPSRGVLLGVLIGAAGLVFLVAPWNAGGGSIDRTAVGVVLVGAFCWAAGSLYTRTAPLPRNVLLGAAMEMLAAGAVLLAAGLVSGEGARLRWSAIDAVAIASVAYLAVFGSVVAFSAYAWLLGNCPATRVATYAYVNPVVAVLLGWWFADEALTARTVGAMAVIVAGVVIVNTARARPQPIDSAASPSPRAPVPTPSGRQRRRRTTRA